MLQDKYLPQYHFNTKHSIGIDASPEVIFPVIEHLDFSGSMIIRLLFKLRGIPSAMMSTESFEQHRFFVLKRKPNEDIIIGLIGQFWRPSRNLQVFKPDEFESFRHSGFAKATLSFRIAPRRNTTTLLETETRIQCTDEASLKKFSRYWFFIRPFSGLIRIEILKAIKAKAEKKT